MRLGWNNTTNGSKKNPRKYLRHNFNCNTYNKFGVKACSSHYIKMNDMNAIVLTDIRAMAQLVVENEAEVRAAFLAKKEQQTNMQTAADKKKLTESQYRLDELERLMQSVYEDKVLGKIPENICVNLLEKYETEQRELSALVADLMERLAAAEKNESDVDKFISRLKQYYDVQELTREMCLELIEYITVDAYAKDRPREIQIYYKFLDEPLPDTRFLF